ncbi:amidase [Oenococcus oeni]|uniref:amidase n=1 Tax=Oenococcus oeni TaxID=1247 RepID=UPI0008F8A7D0|nr:amidase [Oenococcus oeni]OIM25179.1 amidase [Oenococcus oeni]
MEDASRQAELVREGITSSSDLVEQSLNKIEKGNSQLNAVTYLRADRALEEAKGISDHGQPFFGVPILLKGLGQKLAGEPATASSRLLKKLVADQTDFYVQALQKAGFIVIGQTNAPEFGFKNITDPTLYGPTRNPWNLDYYSGGSSGGAASGMAADFVSIASGSDGGGSIRIPASFSSLIGLKPTRGRIPVGPTDWRTWQGASISFALTRSVRDNARLLDAIQTVQPAAAFTTPLYEAGFFAGIDQLDRNLTIAYTTKSPVGTEVSDEAKTAVENAVDFLRSEGFQVEEQENPLDGKEIMQLYYLMNAGETAAMFADIEEGIGRPTNMQDMELMSWVIYQAGKLVTAGEYSQALSKWDISSYQMNQFHENYDLYLTPTTAYPAPKLTDELISPELLGRMKEVTSLTSSFERQQLIYDAFLPSLALTPFTQQANLTGEPAISLPTHLTAAGLPLGIQFQAAKGREIDLLRIARLFEKHNLFHFLHKTIF